MINTYGTPEFGVVEKSDQPRDKSGRWTKGPAQKADDPAAPYLSGEKAYSEDHFWNGFYPIPSDDDVYVREEHELEHVHPKHIWTLVEGEDSENIYAIPGRHKVNRIGYAITEHPWSTGKETGTFLDHESDFPFVREDDVAKMSPREIPAVAGAHWTVRMSQVADRIEPYAAKRRKPIPRPFVDRHLPTVKRVGGKLVQTGRHKAAETARAISYDLSSLNDKDKLIREVATGQGKVPSIAKSFIPGKGYVPAVKAGKGALRGAAVQRKKDAELEALIKPHRNAQGRKIFSNTKLTGPGKTGVVRRYPENHPRNTTGGGFAMPDGRGGGAVFADDDLTFSHEMAHIKPKRNFVNYRNRAHRNPRAAGGEEGRAEYLAHGHAGPTYPDYDKRSPEWRAGYEEVQRRMSGVRKSFIPGEGYVKAVDVGADALRRGAKLRASRGYDLTRMGKKGPQRLKLSRTGDIDPNDALLYRKYMRGQQTAVNVHRGAPTRIIQTKRGPVTVIEADPKKIARNASAYAVQTGGRKGGRYLVVPPGTSDRVLAHELAHVSPNRSSFRMFQIHNNGKVGMEEARADMTGPSYYRTVGSVGRMNDETHSGYAASAADPGYAVLAQAVGGGISPRQAEGYRLVQDVIAEARGARIHFEHDSRLGAGERFYSPAFGYKAPDPHPDLGTPSGKFHGNQYVDWNRRRRRSQAIKAGVWGGVGTGAGIAAYRDIKHKKVEKALSEKQRRTRDTAIGAGTGVAGAMGARSATYVSRAYRELHSLPQYKEASPQMKAASHGAWGANALREANSPKKLFAKPVRNGHLAVLGGAAAVGAGAGYALSRRKKVQKGAFIPNDGIRSTVSKMGPDQSELHVAGSSNQRRKPRLRKLPPDAVRRTR